MKKTNKVLALLLTVMMLLSCFVPVVTVSAETATTKASWTIDYDFTTAEDAAKVTSSGDFISFWTGGTPTVVTDEEGKTAFRFASAASTKDASGNVTVGVDTYSKIKLPGTSVIGGDEFIHMSFQIKKKATEKIGIGFHTDKNAAAGSTEFFYLMPTNQANTVNPSNGNRNSWMHIVDGTEGGDGYRFLSATNEFTLPTITNNGTDGYVKVDLYYDRLNNTLRAMYNGQEFTYATSDTDGPFNKATVIKSITDYAQIQSIYIYGAEDATLYNNGTVPYTDGYQHGAQFRTFYVGSVFDEIEDKITALADITDKKEKLAAANAINAEINEYAALGYATSKVDNYADLTAVLTEGTSKANWTIDYDFTTAEDAAKITNSQYFQPAAWAVNQTQIVKATDHEGETALRFQQQLLAESGGTVSTTSNLGFGYFNVVIPGNGIDKTELVHVNFKIKKSPTERVSIGWSNAANGTGSCDFFNMFSATQEGVNGQTYMNLADISLGADKRIFLSATNDIRKPTTFTNNGIDDYAEVDLYVDRINQTVKGKLNGEEFTYYYPDGSTYTQAKFVDGVNNIAVLKSLAVYIEDAAELYNADTNGYTKIAYDGHASGPYFRSIYVGSVFDEIEDKIAELEDITSEVEKIAKARDIKAEVDEYVSLGYSTGKIENYADLEECLVGVTSKANWTIDYDFTTAEDAAKITDTSLFTYPAWGNGETVEAVTDSEGYKALSFKNTLVNKDASGNIVDKTDGYFNIAIPGAGIDKTELVHVKIKVKKSNPSVNLQLGWGSSLTGTYSTDFLNMPATSQENEDTAKSWMYLSDVTGGNGAYRFLSATSDIHLPKTFTNNGTDGYAEIDLYMDRVNGTVRGKLNGEEFTYSYPDGTYTKAEYIDAVDNIAVMKSVALILNEDPTLYNNGGLTYIDGQKAHVDFRSVYVGSVFDEIEDRIDALFEISDAAQQKVEARKILAEINGYVAAGYPTSKVENYVILREFLADEVETEIMAVADKTQTTVSGTVKVIKKNDSVSTVQMVAVGLDSAGNMVSADLEIITFGSDTEKTFAFDLANANKTIATVKILALEGFASLRPYTSALEY